MTEKEIAELRRRFKREKSNITHIRGCYVNEKGEIVSEFDQSVAMMTEDETDKFLALLRRTLSGTPEKNLIDITFDTQQVAHGEEHGLLMALRGSALKDEDAVRAFFAKVIGSLSIEGNYLILLAYDSYDVPFRSRDGEKQADASSEVFSYLLCSVCPVKLTKPALGYYMQQNEFHACPLDWVVSPPELGFLFPAFDERSTNLYDALYYTRDITQSRPEFVEAVFRQGVPMPAAAQKETFCSVLGEALAGDGDLEIVQAVHEQLCGMAEAVKADKEAPALVLSKGEVERVLTSCGVSEEGIAAFGEGYDAAFGADAALSPRNLVDPKLLEVRTPDVTIQVNPERSDLLETRVIDGVQYLLIRAGEDVEVNGVKIRIG